MSTTSTTRTPPTRTRRLAIVLVVVLVAQALLIVVGNWAPLAARLTGDEVRLRVAPLDPIDPFRGAYVSLDYPDLPGPDPTRNDQRGTVFVPLHQDGQVWVGGSISADRPAQGPYLRCERDWRLRCGIDSYFLPQRKAAAMERDLRDGEVTAVVRVDGRGHAALITLEG